MLNLYRFVHFISQTAAAADGAVTTTTAAAAAENAEETPVGGDLSPTR